MSVELYFDMIGRKTAALISASIEAGALLATDDEAVIARYRALRLGARPRVPAQRRPARDLGREQATGKEPTDLARHKKTLPVIYALEHGVARGPRAPRRALSPCRDPASADVAEIVDDPRAGRRPRLHARPRPAATATRALAELDGLPASSTPRRAPS